MSKAPVRKSATARKSSATASVARKAASRSKAENRSTAGESVEPSQPPRTSKNILTAGIKALANAHGEVVARQSRVFESLLGLGHRRDVNAVGANAASGDNPSSGTAPDPFGFKKFEDVFDQRVARTLQRLDVPSGQAFADISAEVERLRAEITRIKSSGKKR